jgi:5-methylcytosine-specific restriction endonuclease McrA
MTIEEAINKTNSMAQAAALLDMKFSTFKRKAGDLYIPNQGGKGTNKSFVRNRHGEKRKDEEVFVENSTYARHKIKDRIIRQSLKPYICQECGLDGNWNGKVLSLQLDHINGINNDNRLENLRFLCPNCHSQTDTWCGKGKRKPV